GNYIKKTLKPSRQIGNKRNRLPEQSGIKCNDLDSLLPIIRDAVKKDYNETVIESHAYNWNFSYFVAEHERCENTIRICNVLRSREETPCNCMYPLITIRKFNGNYYCWKHTH